VAATSQNIASPLNDNYFNINESKKQWFSQKIQEAPALQINGHGENEMEKKHANQV
jgi:hypothetical protein